MKKTILLAIVIIMNLSTPFMGHTQNLSDFIFEKYSIKNGMSQSSANCLFQDKLGYIWVGSQAGLDRFDGYHFKQYNHDLKNEFSRAAGWVIDIKEDDKGNIWSSDTYGNIAYLNRINDHWENISIYVRDTLLKSNKSLPYRFGEGASLLVDNKSKSLWIGSRGTGLLNYDISSKKFKQYLVHPESPIKYGKQEVVNRVLSLSSAKLLVSTDIGLQYFDTQNHTFTKIFNSTDSIFITQVNDVKINGDNIYAATKYGAFIYNTITKQSTVFKNIPNNPNTIASNLVRNIHYSQSSNFLWFNIVNKGIDVINLSNNKVIHINSSNALAYGIEGDNYSNILEDKENNIWLGTTGILKYDPNKRKFGLLAKNFPNDFNLGFSFVWGTFVDSKGHLWLGEYAPHMGIMEIDRTKNTKKRYLEDASLPNIRVWKFSEDSKGNFFAFCNSPNGILFYKKANGASNFVKLGFVKDKTNINDNSSLGVTFLNNKNELIYTGPKPVIISTSSGDTSYQPITLPSNLKKGIILARRKNENEIYVLNDDGIFLWNELNNSAKSLTKNIPFLREHDLYQNMQIINDQFAYISTYGNGLIKVDFEKNTKQFLTLADGIPSLYLYDIYHDKSNNLWLSSNFGIIRYNPFTKQFRSFGPAEGVQDFEFNTFSSFQSKEGELFFGGMSGLNYFFPDSIKDNAKPPVVIIQRFSKKDTTLLVESINPTGDFTVKFNENTLSFDFLAFNFRDAEHNQYAYKMEGYDEDWINVGSRRFASYTNLREGTYTFRVKAANNDGIWNEEGASMVIHILPPPWRTWWAYLLYVIFSGSFIYLFSKYRARLQIKKLENERKNSELAAAKDLQERLLPKTLPVINNLDIAGYLRTSTEVGGDYYDFFEQPDGSLYAICGDATGHGTPSGMLVSITKAGLIGLPQMSPKDMLHELNRVVKKVDLGILRMSLNIALVKDNQITLSSAGMPPYFIYRAANNTAEEIQLSGVPLGSFNDVHFDQTTTPFNKGDILVIISDGLPEAPNLAGDLFDYQKVQNLIAQYGNSSADEVIKQLMTEADTWLAGNHNPDDITLVVIKHK
ncbi:MAG: SpoIIE family protein phosphatase [Chitinophagia bacterium]